MCERMVKKGWYQISIDRISMNELEVSSWSINFDRKNEIYSSSKNFDYSDVTGIAVLDNENRLAKKYSPKIIKRTLKKMTRLFEKRIFRNELKKSGSIKWSIGNYFHGVIRDEIWDTNYSKESLAIALSVRDPYVLREFVSKIVVDLENDVCFENKFNNKTTIYFPDDANGFNEVPPITYKTVRFDDAFFQFVKDVIDENIEYTELDDYPVYAEDEFGRSVCLNPGKLKRKSNSTIRYDFKSRESYVQRMNYIVNIYHNKNFLKKYFPFNFRCFTKPEVTEAFEKLFSKGYEIVVFFGNSGLFCDERAVVILHSFANRVTKKYKNGDTIDFYFSRRGESILLPIDAEQLKKKFYGFLSEYKRS